jgi:hypothetical protein
MLDKFWESLGEEVAGEWMKHVLSPAFLFWAGGLGMYVLCCGWEPLWEQLTTLEFVEQIALLFLVLGGLILSSLVMRQLRLPILRLLEGYWPVPLDYLGDKLAQRKARQFDRWEQDWNQYKNRQEAGTLPRREARRLAELETRTHYIPADAQQIMPTAVGNILRAGESAPAEKYGLDAVVCWPRLWMLLPKEVRDDLVTARQNLMTLTELWAWGLLFLVWSIWSPWAIAVSIVWLALAYVWLMESARGYADLIVSAFDLYRWKLYEALDWPRPQDRGAEVESGRALTEFLWRGTELEAA